jgi:hypothetical protein
MSGDEAGVAQYAGVFAGRREGDAGAASQLGRARRGGEGPEYSSSSATDKVRQRVRGVVEIGSREFGAGVDEDRAAVGQIQEQAFGREW